MNLNTVIKIPPSGSYFEGHFPGQPILPGVAQISLVLDALAAHGYDVMLQGISYIRLRQLVLPDDQLDLVVRELDDGHLRFELKRDGGLVTNGELIVGEPASTPPGDRVVFEMPASLPDTPVLDLLLPHRPPMRFLKKVLVEMPDSLTCSALIPLNCVLVKNGTVPAVVGLEAAAQVAAAWEVLQRQREAADAEPRVGYLVALRDVSFYCDRLPADQEMVVTVRLEAAALPLSHYRVEVSMGGAALVRGMIATFLKT